MAPLEKNWPATWPYYDDAQYTFITGLFTVFGFGATLVGYVIPEKWQTWLQFGPPGYKCFQKKFDEVLQLGRQTYTLIKAIAKALGVAETSAMASTADTSAGDASPTDASPTDTSPTTAPPAVIPDWTTVLASVVVAATATNELQVYVDHLEKWVMVNNAKYQASLARKWAQLHQVIKEIDDAEEWIETLEQRLEDTKTDVKTAQRERDEVQNQLQQSQQVSATVAT
ncbi:MAG: hypothetical protein M1815_002335 [Lichina confinis]|nr:MAG: hypothetical protein M1815_002335 [Lichina confinis]